MGSFDRRHEIRLGQDEAVWAAASPHRHPQDVAEELRTWGVLDALEGAAMLVREMDPSQLARAANLDPLDPDGGPLNLEVLTWSLALSLRDRGGMALDDAERPTEHE